MVYVDFEYNRSADPDMGLVCCCLRVDDGKIEKYWLYDGSDRDRLVRRIDELDSHTFVGFAIQLAECRCFVALGLDPRQFKWFDLFSEFRWLSNADDRYSYGYFTYTPNPAATPVPVYRIKPSRRIVKRMSTELEEEIKEEQKEECESESVMRGIRCVTSPCDQSLLSVEYFFGLLDTSQVIEDIEVKKTTRKRIIDDDDLEGHRDEILDYCGSDIHLLGLLTERMGNEVDMVMHEGHLFVDRGRITEIRLADTTTLEEFRHSLGMWCARNARYAMRGIPLNKEKLDAVIKAGPYLTTETQLDFNREHPDSPLYRIGASCKDLMKAKMLKSKSPYRDMDITWDSGLFADIVKKVEEVGGIKWKRTAKGTYASDSDYLKEMDEGFGLIHDVKKHKDALTAVKSIVPDDDGGIGMMKFIGSDNRQRPWYNPYGTKTGRNAPKATGYIFLQPKWMRLLVDPPKGHWNADLDAHSQEVAIAAAVYNDNNKRKVYLSPDVYIQYAQLCNAYPPDRPILDEKERESEENRWFKEEGWGQVRKAYKSGFLGMQFGMGGSKLRQRVLLTLPEESRDMIDEDWGNRFVEEYHQTFAAEFRCSSELKMLYQSEHKGLMLPDGWRMGPDEDNILTVGNFPVQGTGAVILRRCCELCDEAGVRIYATLHDAISITGKDENMERDIEKARECFRQAGEDILGENLMIIGEPEIVRHGDNWIHDDKVPGVWNAMASRHFPQYVLPSDV